MAEVILYPTDIDKGGSIYLGHIIFSFEVTRTIYLKGFVYTGLSGYAGDNAGSRGVIGYKAGYANLQSSNKNEGFTEIKIAQTSATDFPNMNAPFRDPRDGRDVPKGTEYGRGYKVYFETPLLLGKGSHTFFFRDSGGYLSYSTTRLTYPVDEYLLTSDRWFEGSGITEVININNGADIKTNTGRNARIGFIYEAQNVPIIKSIIPYGSSTAPINIPNATPNLSWSYSDMDGDAQAGVDIEIVDIATNATVVSKFIKSANSNYQVLANELQLGKMYKWRIRPTDSKGDVGFWHGYGYFNTNRQPNATNVTGASTWAGSLSLGMSPRLQFTYSDPDSNPMSEFKIKILRISDNVTILEKTIISNNPWYDVQKGELEADQIYGWQVLPKDNVGLQAANWSTLTYFVTNHNPYSPFLSQPSHNIRTGKRPVFAAYIGRDMEDDHQHFRLQIATNETFTEGLQEFNTSIQQKGWEVFDGVTWMQFPSAGYQYKHGKRVRYTPQSDLTEGIKYYWRMAAIDRTTAATGDWSTIRSVRVGDKLQLALKKPIPTSDYVRRAVVSVVSELPIQSQTVQRIEETSPNVVFTGPGLWFGNSSMRWVNEGNIELSFIGTGIRIYGVLWTMGGIGDIYIDDLKVGSIDYFDPDGAIYNVKMFEKYDLPYREHNIKIAYTGSKNPGASNTYINLDAFEVITDEKPVSFKVEACNNAFDASPTWEDVTANVINGTYHDFKNRIKTATNWGLNVRITVEADGTYSPIEIDGFGISYE